MLQVERQGRLQKPSEANCCLSLRSTVGVAPSFNLALDATDLEAGFHYLQLAFASVETKNDVFLKTCLHIAIFCHQRLCTDLDGPEVSRQRARRSVQG